MSNLCWIFGLQKSLTIGLFFGSPFLPGSILKKLLHTGNSFKVSAVLVSQDGEKSPSSKHMMYYDNNGKIWPHTRSNLASKKDSTYFCVNFIKFGSFVYPLICPDHLLSRSAVRGSVSSCCGCRPWGTTVLRSSSLSLPVWCQVSLLCPPPEGPVPLTPSFTTLSPTPLMVHMNTLWIY